MAHSITTQDLAGFGAPNLVYVRGVRADVALADAPSALEENHLKPDQMLYAICDADGQRLALLSSRDDAFTAAVANELAPVSVH